MRSEEHVVLLGSKSLSGLKRVHLCSIGKTPSRITDSDLEKSVSGVAARC